MTNDTDDLMMRVAITEALHSYCRGIDRLDPEAVRAAFHDDGVLIDYGAPQPIPAVDFADRAIESLRDRYVATQHRITNTSVVARSGASARVETYILAYHVEDADGGKYLHTFNGRWIDEFEDRGDGWRIAQRTLRVDWTRRDQWQEDMRGDYVPSARDRSDAVYL